VRTDDVVQQVAQTADDHLQELLEAAGIVLADAPSRQGKHDRADHQHQESHDDVVRDVEPEGMPPDVLVERLVEY
jgi:hypothetical protein